jgi:hypothetical protein
VENVERLYTSKEDFGGFRGGTGFGGIIHVLRTGLATLGDVEPTLESVAYYMAEELAVNSRGGGRGADGFLKLETFTPA